MAWLSADMVREKMNEVEAANPDASFDTLTIYAAQLIAAEKGIGTTKRDVLDALSADRKGSTA